MHRVPAIAPCLRAAAFALLADVLPAQSPLGAWHGGTLGEPVLRVRERAPGFWVIRQSKRSHFEAPFMYLIAGDARALLVDTGAAPADGSALPLRPLVDSLLEAHARRSGAAPLPLVVTHSHGHRDHRGLDSSFTARPATRVIAPAPDSLRSAFGIAVWPDSLGAIDLGDRRVLVVPTPGHEPAHVMYLDERTGTLLSGDMLYPGMLTVRDLGAFRASAHRLQALAKAHRITTVLGAHVEMTATPRVMYPLGTVHQPREHALSLAPRLIDSLVSAVDAAGDFLANDVHDDFILARVAPPSTDRPAIHGMVLLGRDRLWLSHLPLFHPPHHYQLLFEATMSPADLARYRADALAHPESLYTVEPIARWVLPTTVARDSGFDARVYRGHFERGGTVIADRVRLTVREVLMFQRFTPGAQPDAGAWLAFGGGREWFLAHRIEGAPDLDQLVQVCGGAWSRGRARGLRAVRVAVRDTLARGDAVPGGGRVCRVVYAEQGELAR
jgi:glyoxylase-like metal-dependent hydrolase (beta-lactamase superfamily II)